MKLLVVRGGGKNLTTNNLKIFKNVSLKGDFMLKKLNNFFVKYKQNCDSK